MNSSFRLGTPLRVLVLGAVFSLGLATAGQAFTLIEFEWPLEEASLSFPPDGDSDSGNKPRYSISDNGCRVVFTSFQTKLVTDQVDLNFLSDVFLHDRCATPFPTTTLVSHVEGIALTTANGASDQPVISANGEFVVFRSTATDIASGFTYTAGMTNIFLWDRVANTSQLVSHRFVPLPLPGEDFAGDNDSRNAVISRTTTGRHFVAFESDAKNLRVGDDNGASDIYRFDSSTGLLDYVSIPNLGPADREADGGSFNPAINGDGVCIVFESEATNLVSDQPTVDDINGARDVFRWASGANPPVILLSHKPGLNAGRGAKTGDGASTEASITDVCAPPDTGRFAFKSAAKDLDPLQNDGNGRTDVFIAHNTGDAFLVSHVSGAPPRTAGNDRSESPILSRDGGWVAYASFATDIIAGQSDTANSSDVFVYEVGRGNTLLSHTAGDPLRVASDPSIAPEISTDGLHVAYVSHAKDLDPNQHENNSDPDVFLWNRRWNNSIVVSRRYASLAITGERKSDRPAIAGLGYRVAFTSRSSDIIPDDPDTGGFDDVFVFNPVPMLLIIPHMSVRSSIDRNTLEWITPPLNYVSMQARVHATSPCSGIQYSDPGWVSLTAPSPPANTIFSFTDSTPYPPGTDLCYAIFMGRENQPIIATSTPARTILARTLEDTTDVVKWGSNLAGMTALTQVGIGPLHLIGVANDGGVYGLTRGPLGGFWPINYWPFRTTFAPIQGRPPILTLSVGGSIRTTFVGSHDGRLYAFDPDKGAGPGAGGARWYTSPVFGADVQASVGAMLTMFGGVGNHLLFGTRNPGAAQFFALNPTTGAVNGVYSGGNFIGAINTAASVDYTEDQVVFTSLELTPGTTPSLWCLEVTAAGLGSQCWVPKTLPAGISGGPIERNGRVYVGDDAGAVWAFNAATGAQPWAAFTGCGGGAGIKSFVLADRVVPAEDLYYATGAAAGNALCAVNDDGTPSLKWAISTTTIPDPSAPILVRIDGVAYIYVGSSDGHLYQIDPATGTITGSVLVRSGATIGAPAFDVNGNMIYVGSDAGVVYAVQAPF